MKRFLLMNVALVLCIFSAYAQERTLTGTVTSGEDDNSPLPGVNVIIQGTKEGTITDIDGKYTIDITSKNPILVFSYIGFIVKEVPVDVQNIIDVVLEPDATQLQEIIVTGQGVGVERRRLSTTVDVVNSKDLENVPALRIDQLLQSQLPNTQINMSSGAPGTTSLIRSRGVSSALVSTTPIIYIDGVRVDNLNTASALSLGTGGAQSSALADIPVENIERVEFVKGGAATTLYGADAANGVIQIFTKKGTAGKASISFETQLAAIQGTKDYFKFEETGDIGYRSGFDQSYRLGINGGGERLTYSFSGNVYNTNSFTDGMDQTRYNLRTTVNGEISPKATYRGSVGFSRNKFNRLPNANSSFDRIYGIDQGQHGDPADWDAEKRLEVEQLIADVARTVDITENVTRFQTSHSFIYNPIAQITLNATLGMDYRFSRQQEVETNEYLVVQGSISEGTSDQGSIAIFDRSFLSSTGSFTAQYEENFGEFSIIANTGAQFFRNDDLQTSISASNVTEGSKTINNAAETSAEDFISILSNYGYFVQANIGFKDKYFIESGFRVDNNTAFGKDIGGQFFPKVGFSYVLSDEGFFDGISDVVISQFKIRGSYGEAGNFPPPFTKDALVLVNPYNGSPAFQPGQPGDPNLKPERTKTFELGADLSFINNRISIGITYFDATTEDALFTAPFSPSTGQENQVRNLGEINNKGFELSSSFEILKFNDHNLSINASINTVENKVVSSGGAPEFNIGGFTFLGPYVKEGLPVGYLRGGKPTFGEDGSLIEVEENANVGNPIPKGFGSFGLNYIFKNRLTLFVSGDYQFGGDAVNTNEVLRYFNGVDDDRIPEASKDESFFDIAGVWVESSDYLKIRNISLSYNLPSSILNGFGNGFIKGIRVGASLINPFNFYATTNFDPELTGAGARGTLPGTNTRVQQLVTVGAYGYGTFSAPRQYLGTIRLQF
ncbi:MAG: TonB-dependent receptor [Flammeovirgaceae bacterium]|nr:TonB-dependent receptor [Flammeovirgaceae bacterium]